MAVAVMREIALPASDATPDLGEGTVLFIGTATVLVRYAGFTILTDPNFLHRGQRVRLGYGLRSTRRTEPAMQIEDLPEIDLVVLSHLHEDHFDRVAERKLDRSVPIVTTPHAASSLRSKGFRAAQALETWQAVSFTKGGNTLRISSMPGKHAPLPLGLMLPPSMGSLLQFEDASGQVAVRLYISG